MEGWLSGRKRTTRNRVDPKGSRGFESPSLRHQDVSPVTPESTLVLPEFDEADSLRQEDSDGFRFKQKHIIIKRGAPTPLPKPIHIELDQPKGRNIAPSSNQMQLPPLETTAPLPRDGALEGFPLDREEN